DRGVDRIPELLDPFEIRGDSLPICIDAYVRLTEECLVLLPVRRECLVHLVRLSTSLEGGTHSAEMHCSAGEFLESRRFSREDPYVRCTLAKPAGGFVDWKRQHRLGRRDQLLRRCNEIVLDVFQFFGEGFEIG